MKELSFFLLILSFRKLPDDDALLDFALGLELLLNIDLPDDEEPFDEKLDLFFEELEIPFFIDPSPYNGW